MAINNIDIQDDKGNSYRPMANPDSVIEFTKAGSRTNIASGDTHRTVWGKICKFFADLGTAAFCGLANNLSTTAAGYGIDARQGPVIQAQFNQINSDLVAADGEKFRYGKTADGKRGYIITNEAGADTVIPFSHSIEVIYNSSSYNSSYTFVEEGDYIISSCICKEGWVEKGDPIIELSVAEIYSNYQSTKYSGNNDETAIRFSYFHAKAGNTCRSYITGIDDTRHGYLTILKVS